jgi:hypothetical protein
MARHQVTLVTTIVIDFPEGMELNPELPEVQSYLKEEFKDYLDAATPYILGALTSTQKKKRR